MVAVHRIPIPSGLPLLVSAASGVSGFYAQPTDETSFATGERKTFLITPGAWQKETTNCIKFSDSSVLLERDLLIRIRIRNVIVSRNIIVNT
jgi:hypothetical protein